MLSANASPTCEPFTPSSRSFSETLPLRGIACELLDESVTMHVDYALEGVNEPVKIPTPA
jgi:hypothetical protein